MSSLLAGDPAKQYDWHETHRDMMKNMYRTSYTDMSHGREVAVKSDYPSGYGGHVPNVRHDVLFRNTAFDRQQSQRRNNLNRDAFPPFDSQIDGVPSTTLNPRGAKKPPTYGVVPHDGTTTTPKPPWSVIHSPQEPLSHRTMPPTLARQSPRFTINTPRMRVNEAAMHAGESALAPTSPSLHASLVQGGGTMMPQTPGNSDRLRATVHAANEEARGTRMPSESEVLQEFLPQ